ncbi:hypothetical protein DR64_1521 [Paraburkholderia xenovorans LB400]|jgi:hypothetical protein|uniref:Lipoprotein n=1 Tax=Paraburkholderia xenovorans (strain LB400) TaxID=266265 RepID=Q144T5_PARXL|nr:hypothetical protein [Paraburkholderia xenovorans]ABE29154.1 Hypothetical protein Bxe_A3844 [Paraburkholderia xenovorans LB400]AIP30904.1 hypothetical protein DR64_1521 [Paraburkholderia xenovorans LB400]
MQIKTYTVLTLVVFSSAAFAWQPLTYPIRSQSPYQRSIDTAMCYATANRQTKVNIAREPQTPPRKPAAAKTSSTGVPSRPPLPSSTFSSTPIGASMPAAAEAPGASAPAATTAAAARGAAAPKAASATQAGTTTTATATAATGASATSADNGASETAAASAAQVAAASGVKLPPLPAPEPPMTQYWAAYGACMQARGYVVAQ